ncbi:MAG: hypothetical protein DRN37_00750 [Thermoplasmata archaeon]|nr:MAG: hypothetical protein DRN37_00750 [Thermoplasmata archaeon]
MRWLVIPVMLLFIFPYIGTAREHEIEITLPPGEVKMLEFPLGTKISYVEPEQKVQYHMAAGIKNGHRLLFLTLFSENGARARIGYEHPPETPAAIDGHCFLIITPERWVEKLQRLASHKERLGINTTVVSVDDIYAGRYFPCTGRDEAEMIKYFIKDAVEQWDIGYVLLVGGRKYLKEDWLLPVRYSWLNDRSSSWEYERRFISDLYFADLYNADGSFSSWDSNGNGYFGEFDHEISGQKLADEVDLLPDVYLGRLPVRSDAELEQVIENIISYENNPDVRFNNVALFGGDLYLHDPWDIAEGEYLLDSIAEHMEGYHITKAYASDGLYAQKINDIINEGAGLAVFEGAGNHHLWATHAKDDEKWIYYYEWNVLQLKNDYLPIILTSGARLGQFNGTRECFNWFWVARGKAVASIGPTGLCWIGHGENVTEMFLGNLHLRLCEEMAGRGLLGNAWGNAIAGYLNNFSWSGVAKAFHMKAAEELELFGDPTLKIGGYESSAGYIHHTLHVGGDGPGNYTKIQDAIGNASDGDRIIVHPGVYVENLSIDKSLTITGEDATIKTGGIILCSPDITIRGFEIEGYEKNEGIICYGNHALITENEIHSFSTAIWIAGVGCRITENVIENNEYGIWINGTGETDIENNTLHDNWYGVWGEHATDATIRGNTFSYNAWYAVWMEGDSGSIAENNFSKNWYSIYLYNSHQFNISGNVIFLNIHGPQFVNSTDNVIVHNHMEKNEHYGIYFGWRSTENAISENNFIENSQNARDDAGNQWERNYWSDYLGLKIPLLFLFHFPYFIQKCSFDWHPKLTPYAL